MVTLLFDGGCFVARLLSCLTGVALLQGYSCLTGVALLQGYSFV